MIAMSPKALLNLLIKADDVEEEHEENADVNVENLVENLVEKNTELDAAEEEENNSIFIKVKY